MKGCSVSKMKVLYVTTAAAPYKVEMFECLGEMCDLDVVFEKKTEAYREDGWLRNKFSNFNAYYLRGINFGNTIISLDIISLVQKNRYDCIIIGVYSTPSQILAQIYFWINNIPYLLSSDGGFVNEEPFIKHCIKKIIVSRASYWLSPSKNSSEYLKYYGAQNDRIFLYPFSSIKDEDVLKKEDGESERQFFREKNNIIEKNVVLYVGQIIHRKGIDIILKTAKKLENVGFYIAGGIATDEYANMVEELGLKNVHFVGFKDKGELAEYYRSSNVFVLPTREDIWGLVVNEAMAYGVPVITTRTCNAGVEMIKNDKVGTLLNDNNEDELTAAILKWITKNNWTSHDVLEIAKQYTIEKSALRHYEIIDKLFN